MVTNRREGHAVESSFISKTIGFPLEVSEACSASEYFCDKLCGLLAE